MSGHSKWANIKVKKGAMDRKRSSLFTKLSKDILTAIRQGGSNSNPDTNSLLRTAIAKARGMDMPKENIERLLKHFEERKDNLIVFHIEGFGPSGVAVVVEVETDNKNRTVSELRNFFKNKEATMGDEGSVMYMFDRLGMVNIGEGVNLDDASQLDLIDKGVVDIEDTRLWCQIEDLSSIRAFLEGRNWEVDSFGIGYKAKEKMILDEDKRVNFNDFCEELYENDDVINIFSNLRD